MSIVPREYLFCHWKDSGSRKRKGIEASLTSSEKYDVSRFWGACIAVELRVRPLTATSVSSNWSLWRWVRSILRPSSLRRRRLVEERRLGSGGQVDLEDVPSLDLMTEVLHRMKCASKPDKRLILIGSTSLRQSLVGFFYYAVPFL